MKQERWLFVCKMVKYMITMSIDAVLTNSALFWGRFFIGWNILGCKEVI